MVDDKQLKRRVWLRLLGSPLTILPFLLGMTAMTVNWMFGGRVEMGWFAAMAGTLVSAGSLVTRLLTRGEEVTSQVAEDLAAEQRRAERTMLDELDRRLTGADEDPRPETALRDLRALLKAFEEAAGAGPGVNSASVIEIRLMVGRLFERCVGSLRRTDDLWQTAQRLRTEAARQPLLQQREDVIGDVQASIRQMSDTLVALERLGRGDNSSAELKRLREELDQSLAVAKRVEERLDDLVRGTELRDIERTLELNEQPKGEQP